MFIWKSNAKRYSSGRLMKINVDWRILLVVGIGMLIGSIVVFYWGYQLKVQSESFSHIWVLALGFAWVGSDLIQKAVNKKTSQK